jgi:hypothetical protein
MNKLGMILVLEFFAGLAAAVQPAIERPREKPLLRDGFILRDAAGTLIRQSAELPDGNDVWLFEFSSDVNDSGPRPSAAPSTGSGQVPSGSVLKAGTRLELLPSSALERMVANIAKISNFKSQISDSAPPAGPTYLLSGRVTKYKGRNFIFPNYFLPLRPKESKVEIPDSNAPSPHKVMPLDEPNDVLAMPPDIIEKLRARRQEETSNTRVPTDTARQAIEDANTAGAVPSAQSPDSILVDRTALLVQRQGGLAFSLDALGRNIEHVSLRLLPCEALEVAEREQAAEPEPIRFRVGGIVARYKGESYLLLQKAIRTYSHGNFGR